MYYRRAILLHGVRQLVMFGNSPREKAVLAHVETQTFEATVPIVITISQLIKSATIWRTKRARIIVSHLKPTIGVALQTLHFDWWRADSDAAKRWSTGSQTTLCGSRFIQAKKWTACRWAKMNQMLRLDCWFSKRKNYLNGLSLFTGLLKATLDRRFNVRSAKCGHFAQFTWHLNAIVQKDAQFWCIN